MRTHPNRTARASRRRRLGLAAWLALLAVWPCMAEAQIDSSGLTRASYRRNCLFCHSKAAPEGVSAEILAGLRPVAGLKPRDAMPGLFCRRRCEACKLPDPDQPAP